MKCHVDVCFVYAQILHIEMEKINKSQKTGEKANAKNMGLILCTWNGFSSHIFSPVCSGSCTNFDRNGIIALKLICDNIHAYIELHALGGMRGDDRERVGWQTCALSNANATTPNRMQMYPLAVDLIYVISPHTIVTNEKYESHTAHSGKICGAG